MTKFQSDTAEWWARHSRIARIRKILKMFPEMTKKDGEVLTGCLTTLTRGQPLASDQEAMYRWWSRWFSDVDTAVQQQSRGKTLSERVEAALETLSLPTYLRAEMTNALERLRNGNRMTLRQAGLWGSNVLPKLRTACV